MEVPGCALAATDQRNHPMTRIAVSVAEAATISGLGKTSIYKLIANGKLSPRKLGKRTLVLMEDLDTAIRTLPTGKQPRRVERGAS